MKKVEKVYKILSVIFILFLIFLFLQKATLSPWMEINNSNIENVNKISDDVYKYKEERWIFPIFTDVFTLRDMLDIEINDYSFNKINYSLLNNNNDFILFIKLIDNKAYINKDNIYKWYYYKTSIDNYWIVEEYLDSISQKR